MVRTQVQLTEGQSNGLKRLAAQKKVSVAEVVREFVEEGLARGGADDARTLRERAIGVAGAFRSGVDDLAQRHDDYLAEAYDS
jgi:hypothetical protein